MLWHRGTRLVRRRSRHRRRGVCRNSQIRGRKSRRIAVQVQAQEAGEGRLALLWREGALRTRFLSVLMTSLSRRCGAASTSSPTWSKSRALISKSTTTLESMTFIGSGPALVGCRSYGGVGDVGIADACLGLPDHLGVVLGRGLASGDGFQLGPDVARQDNPRAAAACTSFSCVSSGGLAPGSPWTCLSFYADGCKLHPL